MSNITPESAQRISALVDGQLQGQEFTQVLQELTNDGPARAQWDAYHVIGHSMRAGNASWQSADSEFVRRLSERLRSEVVVPEPAVAPLVVAPSPMPVSANQGFWRKTAGLAALVFLAVGAWQGGERLLPQPPVGTVLATQAAPESTRVIQLPPSTEVTPEMALLRSDGSSVLAPQTDTAVMIRDPRLDAYLAAHRGYAGASVLQVDPGFVQSATFEGARR